MTVKSFAFYRWVPSVLMLIIHYTKLLFFPNSYILDLGKDGQRAYFVFLQYLRDGHGVDIKWLNHPFGENLFYLDCDPLLLGCSKILFSIFPFLQPYSIGFFNLIHFVPLVLSCYFLTRIFEELHVNRFFSVLFALLVGFLSPQWFKMAGNFSLSYVFYLPALIFFLLRWSKENTWGYALLLFLFITASYFSHPYLGLIHTAFVSLVQIVWMICYRSLQTYRNVIQLIILALVPVILYIFILQITDTHLHRNPVAGGFGENYLGVYEWFIQGSGFSAYWLQKLFPKEQPNYFDNASVPFIFWVLLCSCIITWRKIKKHEAFSHLYLLGLMLIPAFLLIVFATGVFGLTKFEWLYEWVYYAKQFRFVARFAWPFYYVLGITSLTGIYIFYDQCKKVWRLQSLIMLLFVVLYGLLDITFMHATFHRKLTTHSNFYITMSENSLWVEALRIQKMYNPSAVVSLPLSLESSFRYSSPFSDTSMINGYLLSWYTNLPLVGGILIRPSETETEAIRESFNLPIYKAPLAAYFLSGPLLLLADTTQITSTEKKFLQRAKYVSSINHHSYYLLTGDEWGKTTACDTVAKYYNTFQTYNHSLVIQKDLEDEPFIAPHHGKGVRTFRRGDGNVLLSIDPGTLPSGLYTASCWVYNRAENAVNGCFVVQSYATDGTFEGWVTFSNPARSEIIHDGWSYTECTFELNPFKTYELFLIGYDFPSLRYIVDDVMIRKSNEKVIEYSSLGRPIRYNSHPLICKDM
ncbi:MAG: hypothetical protein N2167_03130 [Flavobacteriales bacterium]|nr:hypothetical protein [Flavobacteriales bacterium]